MLTGRIVQISVSLGGLPKRAVPQAMITPLGLEGDCWAHPAIHGGVERAVLLMQRETIDDLAAFGYPVFYGALGENLTTSGLDRRQWRAGQRVRAGAALLELSHVRIPCSALDVYGPSLKRQLFDEAVRAGDPASPRWGMSGFYARVIQPGMVRVDDSIEILSTPA